MYYLGPQYDDAKKLSKSILLNQVSNKMLIYIRPTYTQNDHLGRYQPL